MATIMQRVERALTDAGTIGRELNAFSAIHSKRARSEANRVIEAAAGGASLSLAGLTFGVKNLFDLAGEVTLAGSRATIGDPAAERDAPLVERMNRAGAVLIGAQHMGEFAYDFTGENAHYGASRNPHDPQRMTGGSSGGSAAAVAAGIIDVALASDTNGSIRLPAALCGIYGLRPTAGRLTTEGTFPFCTTLDQVGPLAGTLEQLAAAYDVLAQASVEASATAALKTDAGAGTLRVGRLRGWFDDWADADVREAVGSASRALDAEDALLPNAEQARAAAFLITNVESGALHAPRLRERARDYDPATRDRFLAGALLPAIWYVQAQRFRTRYKATLDALFETFDVLLAPASPTTAPMIGQHSMTIGGREMAVRPFLGLMTQPISLAGVPVLTAPIRREAGLPIGMQIIARPGNETPCFRAAALLEREGIVGRTIPVLHREATGLSEATR